MPPAAEGNLKGETGQEGKAVRSTVTLEGIAIGLGAGILAALLAPIAKKNAGPVSAAAVSGAAAAVRSARRFFAVIREEAEDLVFEAQFERMRRSVDRDLGT